MVLRVTSKGIVKIIKTLFNQGKHLFNNIKINDKDIDFTDLPLFALKNVYYNISTYLYYVSNWRFVNVKQILTFIRRSTSITVLSGLLKVLVKYCKEKKILIDNIRLVYTGGSPLSHISLIDLQNIKDLEGFV